MENPLSLLSSAVGFSPTTIMVVGGVVLAVGISSFVGGCHYKEQSYAADQLRNAKAGARLSNQDASASSRAGAELANTTENGRKTTNAVLAETAGKPLTVMQPAKCTTVQKQVQPLTSKDSQTPAAGPPNSTEEVTTHENTCGPALFNYDAMRLYNLSLSPSLGSSELPKGGTETAGTVQVDEAVRQIIVPNNEQCKEVTTQLNSLLDRIEQKQKLYGSTEVGVN